jgi:hypothetical protein
MKQSDFMEVMATWADAEARSTATLIELVTAACMSKLAPPEGEAVSQFTISQADLEAVVRDFHFETQYDEHGTMTMFLTRIARKG